MFFWKSKLTAAGLSSTALIASTLVATTSFSTAISAQTSFMVLKGSGGVANIRSDADSEASVKTSVPVGLVVKSAGGSKTDASGDKWLKVTYGGTTGWIPAGSTFKLSQDNSELREDSQKEVEKPKPEPAKAPQPQVETARPAPVPSPTIQAETPAPSFEREEPVDTVNPFSKTKTEKRVFSDSDSDIKKRLEEQQQREKAKKLAKERRLKQRRSAAITRPKPKPFVTASIRNNLSLGGASQSQQGSTSIQSGYRVERSNLLMRAEPDTSYSPIFSLRYNDVVQRTGLISEGYNGTLWWQVRQGGTVGWVERSGLSLSAQVSSVSTSSSNRTANRANSQSTDQNIENSASARARSGKTYSVTGVSKGLRMRSGPGPTFRAVASIPSNARNLVSTGESHQGWLRVRYGKTEGWVSAQYVREN